MRSAPFTPFGTGRISSSGECGLEQDLERVLERFALELLRAPLELALQVGRLALRGLELRLPLRLAPAELLAAAERACSSIFLRSASSLRTYSSS